MNNRFTRNSHAAHEALTSSEIQQVFLAIKLNLFNNKPHAAVQFFDYYAMLLFLLITRARISEASGLQVKKVDFEKETVIIDQRLIRGLSGWKTGPTKTRQSLILSFAGQPLLARILKERCANKDANDYVFTGWMPADPRSLAEGIWNPAMNGLNIPYRPLYVLRYSRADSAGKHYDSLPIDFLSLLYTMRSRKQENKPPRKSSIRVSLPKTGLSITFYYPLNVPLMVSSINEYLLIQPSSKN